MAKGAYYPIYQTLRIYTDTYNAASYGSNYVSTIKPNTGSDSGTYNAIYNGEKGNAYVDTNYGWSYKPTLMLWWVRETYAGGGWAIGWTNDSKNLGVSVPTLSTSSTDIGNSITINFNRQSSNFTHTIWWRLSGGSWNTLVTKTTATSYVWNTNNNKSTLLELLPNSTSGSFEIYVSTYNGNIEIGHKSVYVTLKVPASIKPSIGTLTVTETNSAVSALGFNSFVAGVSTFKTTISNHVIAGEGANFKNVQFTLGGWGWITTSSTNATFGASGQWNPEVTAIITDSRGRSDSKTITISQTPYYKPTIRAFVASRGDKEPKNVKFSLETVRTALAVNGVNKNTVRYKIEQKKENTDNWVTNKGFGSYANNFNLSASDMTDIENDGIYALRATVQDKIGNSSSFEITLASSARLWGEVFNGEDINFIGNLMYYNKSITDSIAEAGDNYIKYENGTLIQWGSVSINSSMTAWGSLYYCEVPGQDFSIRYIELPYLYLSSGSSGMASWPYHASPITFGNTGAIGVLRPVAGNISKNYVNWLAIGKWIQKQPSTLPSYWQSHIESKITEIRNLQNENTVQLLYITDTHRRSGAMKSGTLVQEIVKKCNIPFIVHGGDWVSYGAITKKLLQEDFENTLSDFGNYQDRLLVAEGNHDAAYDTNYKKQLSIEEIYELVHKRNENYTNRVMPNKRGYYYQDMPVDKVRIIVINSSDVDYAKDSSGNTPNDNNRMQRKGMSKAQIEWFGDVALDVPDSTWSVIVFSHYSLPYPQKFNSSHSAMMILQAFKDKTSRHVTSLEDVPSAHKINRTFDFTGKGGSVIGCFSGHEHIDRVNYNRPSGININFYEMLNDSLDVWSTAPKKTKGTTSEHSFNVISINKSTKKVTLTRIGAGSNQSYTY